MGKINNNNVLARVNFPLYGIQMLTNRHFIVGGGGGSAKTGVANGFEIFELSHNGKNFVCKEITRHETGPTVVMNFNTFTNKKTFLLAGQENHCQLYTVDSVVVTEDEVETLSSDKDEVRNRKPKAKIKNDSNENFKTLKFNVKPNDSIQTDFNGSEPLLRVIRVHPSGQLMATGGTDAIVRLWKFPNLKPVTVLKGHSKEVDDIDFSVTDNHIITIAKDGLAILWDSLTGKKLGELKWQQPEGSKYLYKRCRFGIIEDSRKKMSALYMLANPSGPAKKQKSFLQKWNIEKKALELRTDFDESLSAIAVRNDGRFIAVGTMFSGSVSIHAAFSLQKILNIPSAHSMFVTGLEFLPVTSTGHTITSLAEAAVLSISVDNHICIHTLQYRKMIPLWIGILILFLAVFLAYSFCFYLGI